MGCHFCPGEAGGLCKLIAPGENRIHAGYLPLAHPKPVVVLIDWPVEEDVALIGALARANEGEFPFVAGANRDAGNLLSVGKAGPCVPTPKCATPEISRMSWGGSTSSTVIS